MEVRVLTKQDKTLEVEVIGENETLLNVLKQRLLANPDVASATFIVGHPLLDQPRLFLEMRKGKPEAALKAAAKDVREELDKFETELLKAARQPTS
jgi:DNA-directed RNA polymerase subunit L